MLEVNQLSRKYGNFLAVDNVSFTIDKGEIVGLLGHNGAGKTTIMKMISGFLEPNTGQVAVEGFDIELEPKKAQKFLGYLPENLPIYAEMSVADYLDYSADLKGLSGEEKYAEIKRVIKATDISSKLLDPISTLSRGFKQRVGVAQAILGKPKLLILDEPTNGLDPEQTQHMRNLIKEVAKDATVILSTHIMQEVDALCTRVLMLHNGRLALDEKLGSLRQSNHLLLETSIDKNEMKIVKNIEGVHDIHRFEKEGEINKYRIKFNPSLNTQNVCASIAQIIFDNKGSLYLIHPEQRDLETLFKEVNEGKFENKEVKNAARN